MLLRLPQRAGGEEAMFVKMPLKICTFTAWQQEPPLVVEKQLQYSIDRRSTITLVMLCIWRTVYILNIFGRAALAMAVGKKLIPNTCRRFMPLLRLTRWLGLHRSLDTVAAGPALTCYCAAVLFTVHLPNFYKF